ncbi:MAG: metallophosphoesterase [Gemmatimonadetes bacterium]|nr:metallophosphoesterase [Gemmatimonadota bacterium]
MPELFDLYWNSGVDYGRISAIASKALGGTISFPRPVPATILYPSLFTPAMLFRPSEDDGAAYFELLLATPNGQELTAEQVNLGLVITRGLSWKRFARERPIFDALGDRIQVQAATRTGKLGVATSSLFRGNLHSLWDKYLPKGFQGKNAGIWSVRVSAEALANVATSLTVLPGQDPMDRAIQQLFNQRASPAFREAKTFRYTNDTVQSERPQGDKPILAHHPLVVYPPGQQALKKVVHLTDLHLNLRQDLLARSDARVIEHPDARDVSPPIGTMVHRYSRSVSQLLHAVPGDTDALCIGGDLVDHIRNATPRPLEKLPANAAAVWEAVALSKGTYSKLYQAGPDFIAAYTIFRDFLSQRHVPLIGVSGNHDAYLDGYGISPRVFDLEWRILGNEGIAADHNLTFYEALLAFGPTYHEYSGYGDARGKLMTVAHNSSNFHKDWFDWFHVMFSPFADFRIQLPIQRLVGLGWGMSEHMLGTTDDGQGAGHLPRADGAVAEEQLALLRDGVSASRPTLLVSHFTFASFSGRIGEEPVRSQEPQGFLNVLRSSPPRPGGAIVGRGSGLRPPPPIKMYTDFDEGTFTDDRGSVYGLLLSQPEAFVAVLTGHSHRKAVYVLRQESEGVLAAMKGMSKSAGVDHLRSITSSKAVISGSLRCRRAHSARKYLE